MVVFASEASTEADVSAEDSLQILAKNVKVQRAIQDINQKSLADAIGVSVDTIVRIEAASGRVAVETIIKIAEFFGVTVASLFHPNIGEAIAEKSEENLKLFMSNLKRELKSKNMSVVELARITEIEIATLRNYFSGHRRPSPHNLKKIADALGVHPVDLWIDQSKAPVSKKPEEVASFKEMVLKEIITDLLREKK